MSEPNGVAESLTTENEIIPLLRKQKGFKAEITFVVRGAEAVANKSYDANSRNDRKD